MESNVQELYKLLNKISEIMAQIEKIMSRIINLHGSDSPVWCEFVLILEQCNASRKRIATLEMRIPVLKQQISRWLRNKTPSVITSLTLDQQFKDVVDSYKILEYGISAEKKYLNRFIQDTLIRFREVGLIEIDCEQDLLTVSMWKDFLDGISI